VSLGLATMLIDAVVGLKMVTPYCGGWRSSEVCHARFCVYIYPCCQNAGV